MARSPATDPTAISLAGVTLAQLIIGILGVLIVSNEYANGLIRNTFAAVPRRLPVLWAKVIVLAGSLAVLMVIASVVAFLVGQLILGDGKNTTLAADGVLRAVLGSGLYLAGIGVFGIAIGAMMRNTAGAIAVVVAALLIIPGLASLVLPDQLERQRAALPAVERRHGVHQRQWLRHPAQSRRRRRGLRRLAGGAARRRRRADPSPATA